MFTSTRAWLTSPFPPPEPSRRSVLRALFLGGFVTVFLWFFTPFGLDGPPYADHPRYLLGFGGFAFAGLLFFNTLLPLLQPVWFLLRYTSSPYTSAVYAILPEPYVSA